MLPDEVAIFRGEEFVFKFQGPHKRFWESFNPDTGHSYYTTGKARAILSHPIVDRGFIIRDCSPSIFRQAIQLIPDGGVLTQAAVEHGTSDTGEE